MPSASFSDRRLPIAPTIVTSRPSRIHTVPRPVITSQCHPLQGSRSIRAGIRVSTVSRILTACPASGGEEREVGTPDALALQPVRCGGGGGSHGPQPAATAPSARPVAAVPTPLPKLTHPRKCPDSPGATCSTLRVPLDRSGRVKGSLDLRVAVTGRPSAPVVVFLTGGPGEPGEPFQNRALANAGPLRNRVRVVTIDQRGTGVHALNCPDLQKEMGASDLTPPSKEAVTDC